MLSVLNKHFFYFLNIFSRCANIYIKLYYHHIVTLYDNIYCKDGFPKKILSLWDYGFKYQTFSLSVMGCDSRGQQCVKRPCTTALVLFLENQCDLLNTHYIMSDTLCIKIRHSPFCVVRFVDAKPDHRHCIGKLCRVQHRPRWLRFTSLASRLIFIFRWGGTSWRHRWKKMRFTSKRNLRRRLTRREIVIREFI